MLKMLWNSGTAPLACHWIQSEEREGSHEVLRRLEKFEGSAGAGDQSSPLQPERLDWNVFFNFRQPAFPPSFKP
jgi:hypothetical protein